MKGIIMAGGAGSRLRPLTCDLPKPMVPIMNRPVMHYSIELLKKYKIEDIGVTLQYLPKMIQNYFGDGSQYKVKLHYFIEDTPLGTAGSVKNAQEFLDETFIVISGDALTNIDLSKAIEFHKSKKSIATLILKKVEVPLEYGVVITNQDGAITRFLEKPGWGEVFSDTVNTGIYILEPEVLDYFQPGIKFDFSKDLFPMLLEEKIPMYGYITEEYWCDIGDTKSYLQSHFDVLDGSTGITIDTTQREGNIWIEEGVHIHPKAKIKGPCYIGQNTIIAEDAVIHPFTVIGSNCYIGQNSSIKNSVLWDHDILDKNIEIRGSILCNNIRVGNNTRIYEGSTIGENTYIKEDVTIKPDVKIWPRKIIDQGIVVEDNVIWGTRFRKTFFGKDGIKGYFNTEINPWFVSYLGTAFGSQLKEGSRICVSSNHYNASIMLKYALMAGALSSGLEVFDIGSAITPVTRYAVRFLGLDGGIHVRCCEDDPNKVQINLINNKGANLPDSLERKIENSFISGDFSLKVPEKIRKVSVIKDIPIFYIRHLVNSVDKQAIAERKFKILLETQNKYIYTLFNSMAKELKCHVTRRDNIEDALLDNFDLVIRLDGDGDRLELLDKDGKQLKEEIMIALLSLLCIKQDGNLDVVVPYSAPSAIEKMAETYQCNVIRSKTKKQALMEEILRIGDSNQRNSLERFTLYFDGLATVLGLMDLMAKENQNLSQIIESIPKFHMSTRDIKCPWKEKGRVMRTLIDRANIEELNMELYEGIKINQEKGWTLILPDSDEPLIRIYSEAVSEEYAEELNNFFEKEINRIKKQ
ncbi:MAG: NTP transferase domain-containing protein [Clostridiales bacterium]|nr:NTP transferase domain-containing protein [Clostridiales bacterium]